MFFLKLLLFFLLAFLIDVLTPSKGIFGLNISRSNLAEANEKRNCLIFEMYAYELIAEAQKICISNVDFDK